MAEQGLFIYISICFRRIAFNIHSQSNYGQFEALVVLTYQEATNSFRDNGNAK